MALHQAHMRSIREVCIKDHGEEEVRGWGNRPLGNRWFDSIKTGYVWVVEAAGVIQGHGYIRVYVENGRTQAHIHGLYLTPEVLGQGHGSALMNLMLAQARKEGVSQVTLDSTLTAHDFYRRFGFVDSGPMKWNEIGGSQVRSFPMVLELR
jgi:GNAT superfamily N-acetyltransferase